MMEMVKVAYKGILYEITMQEFEDLRNGYISWADMFD